MPHHADLMIALGCVSLVYTDCIYPEPNVVATGPRAKLPQGLKEIVVDVEFLVCEKMGRRSFGVPHV
jgi:hypothetical protein